MNKPTVTIRDIANRAAVSPSTVSQVLRKAHSVHPNTRRQVEQVIQALGYRRRAAGRPAKEPRHLNIGIVYMGHGVALTQDEQRMGKSYAIRRWFHAIQDELQAHGHHLSFFGRPVRDATGQFENDPLFREVLQDGRLNGVVFIGIDEQHADLLWAAEQGIPVVAINRRPRHGEFSAVQVDNYGAGRQVVDYLMQRGHRRIAMAPHVRSTSYNDDRRDGYLNAMQRRGLEPLLIERRPKAGDAYGDGAFICRQALDLKATALFCDSDTLAVRCIDHLHALRIRVPKQFSVIGFDDRGIYSATGLRPTSVGFDDRMVGKCTADILQKLILRSPRVVHLCAMVRTMVMEYDTVDTAVEAITVPRVRQEQSHVPQS